MENKANLGWKVFEEHIQEEEEEEDDDNLSLCNLTMHESPENDSSSSLPHQEFFEFSNTNELSNLHHTQSARDIVFCGKAIQEDDGQDQEELNEYQKRDYLTTVKSRSFRQPPSSDHLRHPSPTRTASGSRAHSSYQHHQVQTVNITSLTSMSAKSRRRMFMFGPVKFKPEMELSAIKERQGKRLTTLLSPDMVWDGDKAVVVSDGGKPTAGAGAGGKRRRSHWAMVKSTLRGRAHLNNVLTRSFVFGCVPSAAGAGSGNWITVAN